MKKGQLYKNITTKRTSQKQNPKEKTQPHLQGYLKIGAPINPFNSQRCDIIYLQDNYSSFRGFHSKCLNTITSECSYISIHVF